MAIVGGIPDKAGNGYEAKWLPAVATPSLRLSSEKLEASKLGRNPFIPNARGLASDYVQHQTKSNAPNGNWTIRALEREGVLFA